MKLLDALLGGFLFSSVLTGGSHTPSARVTSLDQFTQPGTVSQIARPSSEQRHRQRSLVEWLTRHELIETGDGGRRLVVPFWSYNEQTEPSTRYQIQISALPSKRQGVTVSSNESLESIDPVESPQARLTKWIEDATGLSQKQVGQLVGVSRQTIYRWRTGEDIHDAHLDRLSAIEHVLQLAQRSHQAPGELHAWLYRRSSLHGLSPFQLLKDGEYDQARMLAVTSRSSGLGPIPEWVASQVEQPDREIVDELDSPYDEDEAGPPPSFRAAWH